jgi:hypothetical protein
MNKYDFLEYLRVNKRAHLRCYRAAEDIYPEDYPWVLQELYIQQHNGQVDLLTPAHNNRPATAWCEYSPKYDIEAFDGEVMTFVCEDYVMDVKI